MFACLSTLRNTCSKLAEVSDNLGLWQRENPKFTYRTIDIDVNLGFGTLSLEDGHKAGVVDVKLQEEDTVRVPFLHFSA
jgi:hypothetical protein